MIASLSPKGPPFHIDNVFLNNRFLLSVWRGRARRGGRSKWTPSTGRSTPLSSPSPGVSQGWYIDMYMYIYIVRQILIYIYMHIHTYISAYVYVYVYICNICLCMNIYMYIFMYIQMCIYIYIHMCIYIYTYVYICTYIYIYVSLEMDSFDRTLHSAIVALARRIARSVDV